MFLLEGFSISKSRGFSRKRKKILNVFTEMRSEILKREILNLRVANRLPANYEKKTLTENINKYAAANLSRVINLIDYTAFKFWLVCLIGSQPIPALLASLRRAFQSSH